MDGQGRLSVADPWHVRVRVVGDGTISTLAGTGATGYTGDGGPATTARLSGATGIAIDPGGNLYIADTNNHRVRKITPEGLISTIAGTGEPGRGGDGGPAEAAVLRYPELIALDGQGALYFGPGHLAGMAFDATGEWLYACDAANRRVVRARWP